MLDVHPPTHTVHTWRDFLIHIATIVIGLLIAIGLEQTVEYFHHRHQVKETREALRREHERNATISKFTLGEYRRITAALQTNLSIFLYLQQHPGAPESQWPGKFNWSRWSVGPDEAAWDTAQKSTVFSYMPRAEVRDETDYYSRMQSIHAAQGEFANAFMLTQKIRIRQPDPSRLTPDQIDKEIDLITQALFLHIEEGTVEANVTRHYPEFASPTRAEIASIVHTSYSADPAMIRSSDQLLQLLRQDDEANGDRP
jgi:hypothetical protein